MAAPWIAALWTVALGGAMWAGDGEASTAARVQSMLEEHPPVPQVTGPLPATAASYPLGAAAHQQRPIDLRRLGYIEAEYLVSGEARVFDWEGAGLKVLGRGTYTTRILVRRPEHARRFSGTVIVEPMNPSVDVDLPIMWAESYRQLIADGDAWVGITIKPNAIRALKAFDRVRYARLAMPRPPAYVGCAAAQVNPFAQPTTSAEETGLAWDMLSELGALLKSHSAANPLPRPADRLYMTGQSQSAGYARLYASVFGRRTVGPDGKRLYDGYLYSGSPPWQVPINQCRRDFEPGDPRLITGPAGAPVIEIFAEGDLTTNLPTRRADSDAYPDLFRRYEVAGAAHVDPWEMESFPSNADATRAGGRLRDDESRICSPKGVQASDFPMRYVFDAAWSILDAWVRGGIPAPEAPPLEVGAGLGHGAPHDMFVPDRFGNARGGLRLTTIVVPTARWIGAKEGPFICMFHGYKVPFNRATLRVLYRDHADYIAKVRASAAALVRERWLTPQDAADTVLAAEHSSVP